MRERAGCRGDVDGDENSMQENLNDNYQICEVGFRPTTLADGRSSVSFRRNICGFPVSFE